MHPGQYLTDGTVLTTLQSVDDAVNVDFAVAQNVAAGLHRGETVAVFAGGSDTPIPAKIVAVDSRIDPATRNAMVRARMTSGPRAPAPGASVRVVVPVGPSSKAVVIPVSASPVPPESGLRARKYKAFRRPERATWRAARV